MDDDLFIKLVWVICGSKDLKLGLSIKQQIIIVLECCLKLLSIFIVGNPSKKLVYLIEQPPQDQTSIARQPQRTVRLRLLRLSHATPVPLES